RRVPGTVSRHHRRPRRRGAGAAVGSAHVRIVPPGPRGARAAPRGLCAAQRPAGAAPQRSGAVARGCVPARGGGARARRLAAPVSGPRTRRSAPRREPRVRPAVHSGARTLARAAVQRTLAARVEQRGAGLWRTGDAAARPGRPVVDSRRLRPAVRSGAAMTDLQRVLTRPRDREDETVSAGERPPRREWLVTNGLGGYASGTVAGVITRRYHGLLVSSLPAPLGRMVLLNHLLERVRFGTGRVAWLGDESQVAGPNAVDRGVHLVEFRLDLGLPVWVYDFEDVRIEKRLLMPHGHNTT